MKRLDLQDSLAVLGFILLVGGVGAFSWRAGMILAGMIFFALVGLIERAKKAMSGTANK